MRHTPALADRAARATPARLARRASGIGDRWLAWMFISPTIILLLGVLTVIGTFLSDLLLMWIDPKIRQGMHG